MNLFMFSDDGQSEMVIAKHTQEFKERLFRFELAIQLKWLTSRHRNDVERKMNLKKAFRMFKKFDIV